MTGNTERVLLMQQLGERDLSEWSQEEIDAFIVDAYLSLLKSMGGKLYTSNGLLVEPDMGSWGDEKYDEDGTPTCVACLAGTFFVSTVGHLIPEVPLPFEAGYIYMNVLRFLDGLRYLEVDDEDGAAIGKLLSSMGYLVPICKGYESTNPSLEDVVATKLKRFIDLNPRLTDRLRIATTKGGV